MSGQTKTRTKSSKSSTGAKGKSTAKNQKNTGAQSQSVGIVMFAIAVLLIFIILIKGESFWLVMHNFFLWLGGIFALSVPALLIYCSVTTAKAVKKLNFKFVMTALIILMLSTVVNLFVSGSSADFAALFAQLKDIASPKYSALGTGLLGDLLAIPLRTLMGVVGARIISIVLLVLFVMLFAGITVINIMNVLSKPVEKIKVVNEQHKIKVEQRRRIKEEMREVNIDIPLEGEQRRRDTQSKAERLKKAVENVNTDTHNSEKPIEQNEDFPDSDYIRQATQSGSMTLSQTEKEDETVSEEDTEPLQTAKSVKVKPVRASEAKTADAINVPIDIYRTPKSSKGKSAETQQYGREISEEIRQNALLHDGDDDKVYKFPPVELLIPAKESDDTGIMEELQENGRKLIETLDSFNVKAKIVNICRGPSVTRYEIQPAPGVKISKITNLSDDIALNLAAIGVRIEAPIPGKAAVGIEIPNKTVSMVSMRELIDSDTFRNAKSKLSCVIGRDISGNIVTIDLAKLPHLLIAGTTGSGKSVCVNSILLSILYKATPEEVKMILIDPKMVEFSKYKSVPHLLIPVVSDPKKAAGALNWAVNEMLERYKSFSECGARDIHGYNKIVDSNIKRMEEAKADGDEDLELSPAKRLEQIVIAIDELSDLMMAAPKEVEDAIFRLAQMARAAGMHLVIATQRPSVDVITGVIKANIPSRIALKVSSQTDSRTILDAGGADKLIGKGDMLCMPVGISKPLRVQGGYASDEEIEYITDFIKNQSTAEYDEDVIEQIDQITEMSLSGDKKSDISGAESMGDADPLTEEAIKCVVEAGEASVSLLQRRLKVGYARAGRLVDDLEAMGIVGPHEGSKKRKVLMTYQQWLERSGMAE